MRLVDIDILEKKMCERCGLIIKCDEEDKTNGYCAAMQLIKSAPVIKAVPMDFHDRCMHISYRKRLQLEKKLKNMAPIIHGKWLKEIDDIDGNYYSCSKCHHVVMEINNYCPHCGAKMK